MTPPPVSRAANAEVLLCHCSALSIGNPRGGWMISAGNENPFEITVGNALLGAGDCYPLSMRTLRTVPGPFRVHKNIPLIAAVEPSDFRFHPAGQRYRAAVPHEPVWKRLCGDFAHLSLRSVRPIAVREMSIGRNAIGCKRMLGVTRSQERDKYDPVRIGDRLAWWFGP